MRFSYSPAKRPVLPVTLSFGSESGTWDTLVDSGADVNTMPWSVGEALRAQWDLRKATLRLAGTLAGTSAMPLLVSAKIGELPLVRLAFASCQTDQVPLILGQTNFFMEFDVCFFRSRLEFSVVPKGQGSA